MKDSGLRLISKRIDGDRVAVAKFRGKLQLRATVIFGWLDGVVDGEPEMQLKPEAEAARRLPRPIDSEPGFYNSFVISNAQQIAVALFGIEALRKLMAGETPGLEVETVIVVDKLRFGTDCGLHYEAEASLLDVASTTPVVVARQGAAHHC